MAGQRDILPIGGLPEPPTTAAGWFQQHCLILSAPLFFLIYAFVFAQDGPRSGWFHPYVVAAQRMQAGQRIHVLERDAYAYPPAMAMLAMPLANLSWQASLAGWYLVNIVATSVAFVCAWRLAGAPRSWRLEPPWPAALGMTALVALRFFGSPLENTQFDMVIAALLFAGCLQLWRGREVWSGLLLGAATAMKCTPLLFAPYLIWRGRWRAAAALLLVSLALNQLPDMFWPQVNGQSYALDWCQTFLQPVASTAPGEWHSDVLLNQSLSGMLNRWFAIGIPFTAEGLDLRYVAAVSHPGLLRWLVYGGSLSLLLFTTWRFGRPFQSAPVVPKSESGAVMPFAGTDESIHTNPKRKRGNLLPSSLTLRVSIDSDREGHSWSQLQTGAETAAIVCLMLLLSPMTSKAHYVVLILPVLLLARRWAERRVLGMSILLAALVITGPLCAKDLIGRVPGNLTLAWGMPTWFALLCLAGIWSTLRQIRRAEATPAEASPASIEMYDGAHSMRRAA